MFKKKCLVFLVSAMLVFLAACGQKAAQPEKTGQPKTEPGSTQTAQPPSGKTFELRWGTIQAGGAWQIIGNAMLEDVKKANPEITGSCLPGTSSGNALGVHEGKFNIAFGASDNTALAWNGEAPFKEKIQDIRNIQTNFPFATHIVVRADSGIEKIEDLKGKKVSPGPKGVSGDTEFQRLLKLYGMSVKDVQLQYLSFDDAAQQFIDGHLDCLALVTVPPPFAPVINVASQRNIKLLSLPDDKIAEMAKFPGVRPYTMPPGIYKGVDYPVKGIMARSHLFVHKDVPDEVVYKITKTITENHDRYGSVLKSMTFVKQQDLVSDVGIPFHPGAVKYYKEKGLMK